MPSARDLMQKADALMRSNRNLGGAGTEHEIPVLTDVVIAGDATVLRHHQVPPILRTEPPLAASYGPDSVSLGDELEKQKSQRETDKRELAESVYFEVLRSLDIDGHDGMRERLSTQLMPVFEQMGRDLVSKAEQALAEAIRDQVAAAIERKLGVPPASHSSNRNDH